MQHPVLTALGRPLDVIARERGLVEVELVRGLVQRLAPVAPRTACSGPVHRTSDGRTAAVKIALKIGPPA